MKYPYKFKTLNYNEIIMLPRGFRNPFTDTMFDFVQLCGDYIIFGLSTESHVETMAGESKTLRELYEEQRTKK